MMKNNQKSAQITLTKWAQEVLSAEITHDFGFLEIMMKKLAEKIIESAG